jgi:acyl-coenzyme A thioesterase PaaI-like protein
MLGISSLSFQDQIPGNHCYGCGPENEKGLQIKSFWSGKNTSTCTFNPLPYHSAGPLEYLNGGIIATLIDCHCICTAIANGYKEAGREIGQGELIWYVTANLEVSYLKPAKLADVCQLEAKIIETSERKTHLHCDFYSAGVLCTQAKVLAIKVPNNW